MKVSLCVPLLIRTTCSSCPLFKVWNYLFIYFVTRSVEAHFLTVFLEFKLGGQKSVTFCASSTEKSQVCFPCSISWPENKEFTVTLQTC